MGALDCSENESPLPASICIVAVCIITTPVELRLPLPSPRPYRVQTLFEQVPEPRVIASDEVPAPMPVKVTVCPGRPSKLIALWAAAPAPSSRHANKLSTHAMER